MIYGCYFDGTTDVVPHPVETFYRCKFVQGAGEVPLLGHLTGSLHFIDCDFADVVVPDGGVYIRCDFTRCEGRIENVLIDSFVDGA